MNYDEVKEKLLAVLTFCLSPLLLVLTIWPAVKRGYKWSYYAVASVFAWFGAYLPPTSDAYRYRQLFYTGYNIHWGNLYQSTRDKDWLYFLVSNLFGSTGMSFEFFKLLILIVCYWSYTWMFCRVVESNEGLRDNKKMVFMAWLAMLFSIRLFTLTAGIRFGIASTLVIVAFYLLSERKLIKGSVLYLLCFFTHFSVILFAPFTIVSYLMTRFRMKTFTKIIIMLVVVVFFGSIMSTFFNATKDDAIMSGVNNGYVKGTWGTEAFMNSASFGGMWFFALRVIPVFPLTYYLYKANKSTFLCNLAFCGILFLCISLSSYSMVARYANITIAITFIFLLKDTEITMGQIKTSLVLFLIVFAAYAYSQRKAFAKGYAFQALTIPAAYVYPSPYSDSWVSRNIDWRGEFY